MGNIIKPYALITGASSGIGYEFAVVLAKKGYNLLVVSNETVIEDKAVHLHRYFPDVEIVPVVMNLGSNTSARELYEFTIKRNFNIEVLVNNAGVYHDCDFLDDSVEFNSLILNLHSYTPAMLCYYYAKDMVAHGRGYILNISSVTSNYGFQRMSTYSSTKGFLRLLSRSLHVELKDRGVFVTCVRPGAVATSLYEIKPALTNLGLAVGAMMTPQVLAQKGIHAMFAGVCELTPGIYTLFLDLVRFVPTWVLLLIRKWGIFCYIAWITNII